MPSSVLDTRPGADSPDGNTQLFNLCDRAEAAGLDPGDLVALVRADLRRAWERGERRRPEEYRSVLEAGAVSDDHWLGLVVLEAELRRRFGPPPEPDEYARRFPALRDRLPAAFAGACPADDAPTHRQSPTDWGDHPLAPAPGMTRGPVAPDVCVPGYEVLGVLGRGGMGVVYQARQAGLNRLVALKMILAGCHAGSDERCRFRQEAEAVAALRHPNIVQIYEIGEYDGKPFYSMEYVEGGTLAQRLAGRPQSPAFAAEIAEAIARGVHAAHCQNIIHRDLKPANILLSGIGCRVSGVAEAAATESSPDGVSDTRCPTPDTPKITDFGLAKRLDAGARLTLTGVVAGTPQYMAPEQMSRAWGSGPGPAADVYSVGVILYEMLTGRPPFAGGGAAEIMQQVIRQEPARVRDLAPTVPKDLETVCLKCLQKEQHRRYASAEALADDLRRFLDGKPVGARPVTRAEQAMRWCRRNPAVASLLLVVALALAAGAAAAAFFALDAAEHARRAEESARESRRHERRAPGGDALSVHYDVSNVSGRSWPVPPRQPTAPGRPVLRLYAAPLAAAGPDPARARLVAESVLPVPQASADDRPSGELTVPPAALKPGRYRLRLVHGWLGDDFVPVSEWSLDVTVPDPPAARP